MQIYTICIAYLVIIGMLEINQDHSYTCPVSDRYPVLLHKDAAHIFGLNQWHRLMQGLSCVMH